MEFSKFAYFSPLRKLSPALPLAEGGTSLPLPRLELGELSAPVLFVWNETLMGFKSLQFSVQQILFLIDNLEIQVFSTCNHLL